LGTTYRATRGAVELGLHLDATLFTLPGTSGVIVRPGLPVRVHAGHVVRIDFGVYVPVTASYTTEAGVELPFALAINIVEPLHLGVGSGFYFQSLSNPFSITVPFEVFAGYAIGGKNGPVLDIDPFFRLPDLGATENFQVGVKVGSFFYL
jgi:hypothetical protein